MTLEWWHAGGMLMGLIQAAYLLVNQHYRIAPRTLMLWRGYGVFILLLPFVLLLHNWPLSLAFYLTSFVSGLIVGVFDRLIFRASIEYGAGVTSRLLALCLPISFALWSLLHPDHLTRIMDGSRAALVPLALCGTVASVFFMRKSPLGRSALAGLIPVYFLGGLIDVLNKTAMTYGVGHGLSTYLTYGCTTALCSGLVNSFWPEKGAAPLTRAELFTPANLKGGISVVLIITAYLLSKTSSLASTPNPAFVVALGLTAPFWVILWNRWRKVQDDSNLLAGLGCVASALLLILATM